MRNKFNFNRVVDLYRDGKIEEGCCYLYENIDVFINGCKSIVIDRNDYDDIVQEAILEGHESILKSLDNGYGQIYNYVRTRIMGKIKNYYIKMYRYNENFHKDNADVLNDIEIDFTTNISDNVVLQFIIQGILSLSEKERSVVYLRIFNYPGKTWEEISEVAGGSVRSLSSIYVKSIRKIKKYLETNGIIYENLF